MARSTHRPGTVSFAAGLAAIVGLLWLFRAALTGVGASLLAAQSTVLGLAAGFVMALYFFLGFGALLVAGGLYGMHSWARTVALVVFGAIALVDVQLLLNGDLGVLLELGVTGTAFGLLLVEKDAFVTERPDVTEEDSAVDLGS